MVRGRLNRIRQRVTAPRPAAEPAADRPARTERSSAPGWFIAVEGGDGAGKSTQIAALAEWLRRRGFEVVATREPGGTELGRQLREILLHRGDLGGVGARTEALLFAADRADHIDKVVKPALARGAVVLTDRHVDSSIAYQCGGRGLPMDTITGLSVFAVDGVRPDLTLLLDLDPAVASDRTAQRAARPTAQPAALLPAAPESGEPGEPGQSSQPGQSIELRTHLPSGPDRLESEPLAFHARVRAVFRARAAADPGRYLVLDATEPPGVLTAIIQDRLAELLPQSPREIAEEAARLKAIADAEEAERARRAAQAAAARKAAEASAQRAKDEELAAAKALADARQAEAADLAAKAAAERAEAEEARLEARRQAEANRVAAEKRAQERSRQLAADAAGRAEAELIVRRAEARAKAQAREQAAADLAAKAESEARTRQLVAHATASLAESGDGHPPSHTDAHSDTRSGNRADTHSGSHAPAHAAPPSIRPPGSTGPRTPAPTLADELLSAGVEEPEQKPRRWRSKDDS